MLTLNLNEERAYEILRYYIFHRFLDDFRGNRNPTKWPNTQTIRRQIADELFECVWPLY